MCNYNASCDSKGGHQVFWEAGKFGGHGVLFVPGSSMCLFMECRVSAK